jgi:hypothetical protein
MDPNITYMAMFNSMSIGEFVMARIHATNLKEWLDKGGFYPTNYTEVEVKSYLANVLRRTVGYD